MRIFIKRPRNTETRLGPGTQISRSEIHTGTDLSIGFVEMNTIVFLGKKLDISPVS